MYLSHEQHLVLRFFFPRELQETDERPRTEGVTRGTCAALHAPRSSELCFPDSPATPPRPCDAGEESLKFSPNVRESQVLDHVPVPVLNEVSPLPISSLQNPKFGNCKCLFSCAAYKIAYLSTRTRFILERFISFLSKPSKIIHILIYNSSVTLHSCQTLTG